MGQANRYIKDNPALDHVDHALGRPFKPFDTYRDHFATDCPKDKEQFRNSEWWTEGKTYDGMTFFHVTDKGRQALADELSKPEYGRLYKITAKHYDGETFVFATSPSKAGYAAYVNADLDWSYMEYRASIRVRLAR